MLVLNSWLYVGVSKVIARSSAARSIRRNLTGAATTRGAPGMLDLGAANLQEMTVLAATLSSEEIVTWQKAHDHKYDVKHTSKNPPHSS